MHPALIVLLAALGIRVAFDRSTVPGEPTEPGAGTADSIDAREFQRLQRQNERLRRKLAGRSAATGAPAASGSESAKGGSESEPGAAAGATPPDDTSGSGADSDDGTETGD